MTYDTPQFDHPARNKLSDLALEWYDTTLYQREMTRDAFHMFILGVIDATASAAGAQVEELTKERDALEVRIGALIVERSDAFFKVIQERDEWLARHAECCRLMGECMQDRADMATERDTLALEVDQWRVDFHELRLERDALAADAARYRWLRSSRHNDATVMTYVDGLDDWIAWADGEDVDTSVDKAMRQAGVQ